jgi:hypothetical protein
MGRLAAPAMAVLGNGAGGVVHVFFDGLGAVSLRSGRVWGNGDGDVGVRDRQLDHEDAWGSGNKWIAAEATGLLNTKSK